MPRIFRTGPALLLVAWLAMAALFDARAELRVPGWWDPDGVGSGQDWHYRVPVTLPAASSVNSTARVDFSFATLAAQLRIYGTFDINSIRVVRPGGTLAAVQEYTDRVHGGATDAAGNGRGEIRWIVEDGGAQTYHVYFDIAQNGAKSPNPQPPVNGNFEHSTAGATSPAGWNGSRAGPAWDAQVRPAETVIVTDDDGSGETRATDGNPHSGGFSYLLGARSSTEPDGSDYPTMLTRVIAVPATNPGHLTLRWKPQGWDSSDNGVTSEWDFIRIEVAGASTMEIVGPAAGNYATRPFSPNMTIDPASASNPGYGQYNGWDMATSGSTRHAGMTAARHAEPWWTHSIPLAPWAGQTVTLRFRTYHNVQYKSWFLIDDVEWSVVEGTPGVAEAFGVSVTTPPAGTQFTPGRMLPIAARVDARPAAAANPVTADVLDPDGAVVAAGVILYNDGTHGDAVAGDAIWTNDGSVPEQPTYVIPLSAPAGTGWTLRLFARDASSSLAGAAQDGLAHRNGHAEAQTQENYWNIAERPFAVIRAHVTVRKTSSLVSDPVNGTADPKAIPGAVIRYCIIVTNEGTAAASDIVISDTLPAGVTFVSGSILSGASCAGAMEDSDSVDASVYGDTITASTPALAGDGGSVAIRFDALMN